MNHPKPIILAENSQPHHDSYSDFDTVLRIRLSRRQLLLGGIGMASTAVLSSIGLGGCAAMDKTDDKQQDNLFRLGFTAVPKQKIDAVVIPTGYHVSVLYRLGDPISATTENYQNNGHDKAESFASRAGDHHDGMHFFGINADGKYDPSVSDRGLLCINHEAITSTYLHPEGQTIVNRIRVVPEEVLREFYAHGISVIEVYRTNGIWAYRQDSNFNRRIHTLTEMTLSGPAAQTPLMITRFSPTGNKTRGTVNNCANGYTPWGTYLTCEENWANYFRRIPAEDDSKRTTKELASFLRYGIKGEGRELWATITPDTDDMLYRRWNVMKLGTSNDGSDDFRHAANTFGWVVEIDPFDPSSVPKKRTALGRFAHEGAWLGPVVAGQPLAWYMACDSRNEYIYKFVSTQGWDPADATLGMKAGDKYLDDGRLYVARFNPDGTGQWLELKFGLNNINSNNAAYGFANQAEALINARLAADAAGATKMDRPEWGAVNPINGEVYFTLTNSNASSRPLDNIDAANPRFYNDKKTTGQDQKGNPNGHIIRFAEMDAKVSATSFHWDIFLFGARSSLDSANVNISQLTPENDFSSPDGLWFSKANPGLLWIETDDNAYTDVTNCMLLAAIPGKVGDGEKHTISSTSGDLVKTVDTYVGKPPGEKNLRRFLIGPNECEITGIAETPDGKTLFINIQHPGEDTQPDYKTGTFGSHWPEGGKARPRSATIVVTRNDGGHIAL